MTTFDIHGAKTRLTRLVEQAEAGEEIVITRAGKPVARLVGLKTTRKTNSRKLGLGSKQITFPQKCDKASAAQIAGMFEHGE